VDHHTDEDLREKYYEGIRVGNPQIISNYGVMTTGNDIEEVDCIIMGRATKNLGLFTQMLGRGLRLSPGKNNCIVINLTSEQHTLIMFKQLFGTMTPTIKSVRELIREKQEKEREELNEELASEHIQEYRVPLTIREVVAYESNILIGNGWRPVEGTQDYAKEWTFKDKPQKLIVEEVFTGGYLPVHIDHNNRHHVIEHEVVSLLKAQRLCQEYKTLKEHKFNHSQELKKPENADLPIEEEQLDYLEKRKVPMKPKGYIAPRKMTEEQKQARREALLKEMKQKHYHQITAHLAKYGAHFTPGGKGRRFHSVSYKDGGVESV
jgi:type I site-specific restriction endonuclease